VNLVFDTSFLSAFLDKEERALKNFDELSYDSLSIPLATDAELRFGYNYGTKKSENLEKYDDFKQHFNAKIIFPDQNTSLIYADLASWCRKKGISLSNNDFWIASMCVQTSGKLLTLDKDFAQLPQLRLVSI